MKPVAPHPITRRATLQAGLSLLLPSSSFIAAAEPAGGIDDLFDRVFRPLLAQHDIPGLAVAVTDRGRRHFASFGVASKTRGQPVTEHTLFEIGSLSKTITATLAGYAVARGAIRLDEHPGRYLPRLRGTPIDAATLLHLGTYTAGGLPLQFPDEVTYEGLLDYYRAWKPSAAPGRIRRYSNPSIGLFGHLAALATGRDFGESMQEEVFPALGLSRSHLRVPPSALELYAWGHDKAGREVRVNPGVLDAQAYGVKSTAADMIRFIEANLQPRLLAPAMRQAVQATQVGHFRAGALVQGLGWEQYPEPASLEVLLAGNSSTMALDPHEAAPVEDPASPSPGTWFNKTGSTNGFGAYAAFVPARRTGIVILANRNFPNEARVRAAHAVLQALA